MKRILIAILSMILIVSLAACGSTNAGNPSAVPSGDGNQALTQSEPASDAQSETPDPSSGASDTTPVESTPAEPTGNSGGKTLVVVYSASGNTKRIADVIVSATGGDLFEITPKEPYTSDDLDWTNRNSRVSKEHDDESLRNVELMTTTVENWDEYDAVFIGYPKL